MKQLLLSLLLLITTQYSYAQADTLFTTSATIPCIVKEITPEMVKYSHVGEELVNSVYRNAVQKIVFHNGRVQTFTEAAAFKKVSNRKDFDNVTVTQLEGDVKGLFKIGEISSAAQGATLFSDMGAVKERAFRKIKIMAAMMGANVVYLTQNQTVANSFNIHNNSTSATAGTFLSGAVYTTQLLNAEEFKARLAGKTEFNVVEKASFKSGSNDMTVYPSKYKFKLREVKDDNGLIILDGDLQGASKYNKFRIASFDEDFFYIFYEEKGVYYNVKLVI
ncbi:hypothetical protein I0P70_00195 [Pontibacter sp. FD36]|uniref:hypothetical protein n=1 Tax=Pontibacter sp. FD36 TaxID=2789860 RepID=UPI0018ABDC96|nr:hypothetical protein [Pontibacter sp. FD36]MBF8961647.1 hypothetical protein [Pontibacter sp. FD36]